MLIMMMMMRMMMMMMMVTLMMFMMMLLMVMMMLLMAKHYGASGASESHAPVVRPTTTLRYRRGLTSTSVRLFLGSTTAIPVTTMYLLQAHVTSYHHPLVSSGFLTAMPDSPLAITSHYPLHI